MDTAYGILYHLHSVAHENMEVCYIYYIDNTIDMNYTLWSIVEKVCPFWWFNLNVPDSLQLCIKNLFP